MGNAKVLCIACCNCFGIMSILLCPFFLWVGITEYNQASTYVENSCLVLGADWEKCALRGGGKLPRKQCYQPQWLIRFNDKKKAETTIAGLDYCVGYHEDDPEPKLPFTLEKYRIGRTYPCYHSSSDPLKTVKFEKSTVPTAIAIVSFGGMLLLCAVGSLLLAAYIKRGCRIDDDDNHEQTQPSTVAATTVNLEENAPLSRSKILTPQEFDARMNDLRLQAKALRTYNIPGNQMNRENMREYVVPEWVDVDNLRAKMSEDSTLTVEVPIPHDRVPAFNPQITTEPAYELEKKSTNA